MNNDAALIFSDHLGRFYAKQYSFPPVVGRVLGYLLVCQPMEQSINDLAEALLTSRSAIAGAVKMLENYHAVNRVRPAGSRVDLISIAAQGWEQNGFDTAEYKAQGDLGREGLEILKNAPPERREALEGWVAMSDFLVERMPSLLQEWYEYRDNTLKKNTKK